MATFKLTKGSKFEINKGIKQILVALGWNISGSDDGWDVDASAFGLIKDKLGNPTFFNEGSHALTYANTDLVKGANRSLSTADSSMTHTGDNRVGSNSGDAEVMEISLDQLPAEISEVGVFITIYEAKKRKQNFGRITNCYVRIVDKDSNNELCRYDLTREFNDALSIQVGSLLRDSSNGTWSFAAVGAGSSTEELGDILKKLS